MTETQIKASVVLFLIILCAGLFMVTHTWADEPQPSPADYQNLEDIKQNQKVLEENREAYEAFLAAKNWNVEEVRQLNANGWNVDWSTMKLVPFAPGQESPENLPTRTHLTESAPVAGNVTWTLPGGTEHQQYVIKRCQEKLIEKGITDFEALKYGCSIYLAENERMDPLRLGDSGHAFGICQRNLGRKVWAQTFLDNNPEWKELETQLEYCTSRFAKAYQKYGNVFQATVEHNSPAAADRNKDACHISPCYFERVKLKTSLLTSSN